MPRKLKSKNDDPAEFKRFLTTAEEIEVDPDPKAFERAFKKVVTARAPQPKARP
jgi:hypothetical protein